MTHEREKQIHWEKGGWMERLGGDHVASQVFRMNTLVDKAE